MTVSGRQVASHAASAVVGAVVATIIVLSLFPPGGPAAAPAVCPTGSEYFRTFDAGRHAGWRACITFLPGGTEASLWNVTAGHTPENESVLWFVYHFNVDIPYEAILHQNISYVESHEPRFWNNTQASTGGLAGETARFELYIPSLLYYGDDLSVVREVRFYLGRHEPPIYDPAHEPHQIVSDILSVSFLPPES